MFLIGMVIGAMFIGAPIGMMTMAFCVAAKRGDAVEYHRTIDN